MNKDRVKLAIVITGADGFIGKNLRLRLSELGHTDVTCMTRATATADMQQALATASFVFHLAGVNRPQDPAAPLTLVYVDDVIERSVQLLDGANAATNADGFATVAPQYSTPVGELARQIQAFKDSRTTLMTERVGTGLVRALYATYVSYLPVEAFTYTVPQHGDPRGVFVEMLKTPDCGQFSYFTAHPGITRDGHYHHSKTEKFLVIKGQARFKFRNMQTGQTHELLTSGDKAEVVETVPGWTHLMEMHGADLRLPHSRAMGDGLFELRCKGAEGIGRAFYCTMSGRQIVILHGFIKKTQETPTEELHIARKRLKDMRNGWPKIQPSPAEPEGRACQGDGTPRLQSGLGFT